MASLSDSDDYSVDPEQQSTEETIERKLQIGF